jgi:uncharacterized repeat protein (TIGR03803 family)
MLYGMTQNGGSTNGGTLFRLVGDGSGFAVLHSFTGGALNGRYPLGSPTLSGSKLYGMTYEAGSGNGGTIFSVNASNGQGTVFSMNIRGRRLQLAPQLHWWQQ